MATATSNRKTDAGNKHRCTNPTKEAKAQPQDARAKLELRESTNQTGLKY
jgi:hypothetical protein